MIKGSTVILNEEYINELTRHRDNWEKRYNSEVMLQPKNKALNQLNKFESKLQKALDFQDTVQEILHIDNPHMTVVRTVNDIVLPLSHVKII